MNSSLRSADTSNDQPQFNSIGVIPDIEQLESNLEGILKTLNIVSDCLFGNAQTRVSAPTTAVRLQKSISTAVNDCRKLTLKINDVLDKINTAV